MRLEEILINKTAEAFNTLYKKSITPTEISLQETKKEFEGEITITCFQLAKYSGKAPEATANELGAFLQKNIHEVEKFNVVKGFLNLSISSAYWIHFLEEHYSKESFGKTTDSGKSIMIEYSSPNTNKPLHLGHMRNNFLGYSVAKILEANGHTVIKVQIINDRGIHICKSMVAWKKFGKEETPESSGMKGDKLVGKYYVEFDKTYKVEIENLIKEGKTKEEAEKLAPIFVEAQEMLRKWEQKDPEIYQLWQTMNGWVYKGFEETYNEMGVSFDKLYYESDTYLLGKDEVLKGVEKNIFVKKQDGSVWVDLTKDGLDEKVLLRSDGTSVYMTQDIGTAILRYNDYPKISQQIYTVGSEQEYHFKVLFLILKKLGYKWAEACYHLSYGMVDLPSGKMKSREGTVVDADDLMQEMKDTAEKHTKELGKIEDFESEEATELYKTIGLGAVKYYLLKVDPKKRLLFNPEESIDFHGNTAPFIQYTHARINALLRRAEKENSAKEKNYSSLHETEILVLNILHKFPSVIKEAGENYSPALIANYVYELAKAYNKFYAECSIFGEDVPTFFRIKLSGFTANVIKSSMELLGINVPEKM